jgi:hypothetical protein
MSIELGNEKDLEMSQEGVNEQLEDAKAGVETGDTEKEEVKEDIDFPSLFSYKNTIINFEKCKAISLDMIFDDKYLSYGLCATSLSHKDENEKEPKGLRMNAVEELINYMVFDFENLKDKVQYIKDLKEIDCSDELYPDEKVFADAQKHRKVVVRFENDDIKTIYVYKMATEFVFKKSLINVQNTIQANKKEITMKTFIQNFMMNMSAMNQQRGGRTPSGIIRP